jgi:hypothetical protein
MLFNQGQRCSPGVTSRDFLIGITSRHKANIQGHILHKALNQKQYFESFLELIHLTNEKLNGLDIARPATEMRSFYGPYALQGREGRIKNLRDSSVKPTSKKTLGKPEFLVRLNLRHNATWQGELHWLNADRRVHFRSVMEMVALMEEAMEISGEPKAEYEFRSWQDEIDSVSTG